MTATASDVNGRHSNDHGPILPGISLGEADARAKLIDPAMHARGWTEGLIRREVTEALAVLRAM